MAGGTATPSLISSISRPAASRAAENCRHGDCNPHLRGLVLVRKVADRLTLDEAAAADAWGRISSPQADIAFLRGGVSR